MLTVFAVEWGNEFPAEIDSLWTTKTAAEKQAAEVNEKSSNPSWHVTQWVVRDGTA